MKYGLKPVERDKRPFKLWQGVVRLSSRHVELNKLERELMGSVSIELYDVVWLVRIILVRQDG